MIISTESYPFPYPTELYVPVLSLFSQIHTRTLFFASKVDTKPSCIGWNCYVDNHTLYGINYYIQYPSRCLLVRSYKVSREVGCWTAHIMFTIWLALRQQCLPNFKRIYKHRSCASKTCKLFQWYIENNPRRFPHFDFISVLQYRMLSPLGY